MGFFSLHFSGVLIVLVEYRLLWADRGLWGRPCQEPMPTLSQYGPRMNKPRLLTIRNQRTCSEAISPILHEILCRGVTKTDDDESVGWSMFSKFYLPSKGNKIIPELGMFVIFYLKAYCILLFSSRGLMLLSPALVTPPTRDIGKGT